MIITRTPALGSLWRDEIDNITVKVIGVDTLTSEALVSCRHGHRVWTDAMHLSLFGTELKEIN